MGQPKTIKVRSYSINVLRYCKNWLVRDSDDDTFNREVRDTFRKHAVTIEALLKPSAIPITRFKGDAEGHWEFLPDDTLYSSNRNYTYSNLPNSEFHLGNTLSFRGLYFPEHPVTILDGYFLYETQLLVPLPPVFHKIDGKMFKELEPQFEKRPGHIYRRFNLFTSLSGCEGREHWEYVPGAFESYFPTILERKT